MNDLNWVKAPEPEPGKRRRYPRNWPTLWIGRYADLVAAGARRRYLIVDDGDGRRYLEARPLAPYGSRYPGCASPFMGNNVDELMSEAQLWETLTDEQCIDRMVHGRTR